MTSDNFHFDLTGVPLELSMEVAAVAWKKAVAWRVDKDNNRLILYWTDSSPLATPLPAPLEGEALMMFVRSWLMMAEYGSEPDTDGSTRKGWRVYNEAWGYVGTEWQTYVAIQPVWLTFGK